MSRRTNRRRSKQPTRPSNFFLIALAIGLALLVWLFVVMIHRPVPKTAYESGPRETRMSISRT